MKIDIRNRHDQGIVLGEETISYAAGELIHTEYSHRYTLERFAELAGLRLQQSWVDERRYFAVLYFSIEG